MNTAGLALPAAKLGVLTVLPDVELACKFSVAMEAKTG